MAREMETDKDKRSFIEMAISSLGEVQDDLQGLIEQTRNSERVIRLSAFRKMEDLSSPKKRESIPYLLRYIVTGDEDTKMLAIHTLCSYGEDAAPAFKSLVAMQEKALASQDTSTQFLVSKVLGDIGNAEAAPILWETFRDGDKSAAISAQISLSKLGRKAKAIVPDVLELAQNPKYRESALHILDSIAVLETEDQKKAVAGFLGEEAGMASFYARRILIAQGNEVSMPVFQEAVLSTNKTLSFSGFMGIYMVGQEDPALAIQALEQVKLKTTDQKMKQQIDKSIRELREGKPKKG
jgi:HEAT repeat protein